MASILYENQRKNPSAVVAWVLHIHFDEFFDIPAKDFYFATTRGMETDFDTGGEEIRGLLSGVPLGRQQRERGNDYAEFVLANPHNDTYQDFLDYEDLIERGKVRIFQCFQIEKDYWEGEQRFYGYLKDFTLNETDKTLEFTCVSDMSRTGFLVGARILTRERCGAEFNYNGARDPLYDPCGWTLAQGGNPLFCSKYLRGVDGCIAHGNAHKFYALPALSIAAIEFVPDTEIDFPYDTRACFTKKMHVVLPDWSIVPISEKREGIILATDIFSGEIVEAEILDFQEHLVNSVLMIETARGAVIETRREHLFRQTGAFFLPAGVGQGKWFEGYDASKKAAQDRFLALEDVFEDQTVYNYQTSAHTFLVTDEKMTFLWDVHNNKPVLPIQYA